MCRPYTYVGEYTTEDECIRIYGVSERKKFANDIPKVGQYEICIPKSRILV